MITIAKKDNKNIKNKILQILLFNLNPIIYNRKGNKTKL